MGKREILIGIGILVILLALAGIVSARSVYGGNCGFCHITFVQPIQLTADGLFFKDNHEFNGIVVPTTATSCPACHVNPPTTDLNLTPTGQNYSSNHRYNDTTLAAARLAPPGCYNCHVDVNASDFTFLAGTPTYLTSTTCEACHKPKYDNWTNTLHRVMLTEKSKAQAMGLPEPEVGWANISYVIVTKFEFAYINTTGYFLAQNDAYETETKQFVNSSHAGGAYGTCGRCHTTNWNGSARNGSLPGINGTFSEPGIACERCHKPAGNGHQVVINYSGNFCRECHTGTNHGTDWENSKHAPPPYAVGSNCVFCHSPFDKYKNENVTKDNATGVSCGVCHNIHNMTDGKYAETFSEGIFNAETWAEVSNAKLGFFNAASSIAGGTDIFDFLVSPALLYPGTDTNRKDPSYGTAPINVTGPVSEVLCSKCHYRHGLAHVSGVNLTHSRMNYPQNEWATCADCHMAGINASVGRDLMKKHSNYPLKDVSQSCGGTTKCHITSAQNLNRSSFSIVPIVNEWNQSLHNDRVNGGFFENGTNDRERASSCSKCHSPVNWNPANGSSLVAADTFRGITCQVCHNIHDMGDWLKKTQTVFGVAKAYAWYDRDSIVEATDVAGVPTRYKASYAMMANTTELCGNCHANIREGRSAPGWASDTATTPISPHGFPAKDMFVGSLKQTVYNFECISCHMAIKITDPTNLTEMVLPDSQKVTGHSFKVNVPLLQSNAICEGCHVTGTVPGNLSTTIEKIQADTRVKWNATNITVMNALATINAFTGPKNLSRDLIAKAYWNLRFVSSDGSWGVHNPVKVNNLLTESSILANDALENLGGAVAPSIISLLPVSAVVNNTAGENRTFIIVADVVANISWQINGIEVFNQTSVSVSTYMNKSALQGTWNVTAIASNNNGAAALKWDWVVSPSIANVEMKNTTYNPANLTVLKGTTVIWTNNDTEAHTVTSDTTIFDSGTINPGQTFERTFNDVGTFNYHCTLHPGMNGVVNVISAPLPTSPAMEETRIALELIADNLTAPIGLISAEDGTGRLFIVDQIGVIKILTSEGQMLQEPFLDLRSRLVSLRPQYDERGLLGLAFHPNFTQNGRFFVYYSAPLRQGAPADFDHTSIISEFRVSENPDRANQSSERVLLQVDKPQFNHNAGQIIFGPDGYLYIPVGDGGGANDVGIGHPLPGNGQNISTPLGKILRIDVNGGDPYAIPQDNPFAGKDGLDEIFAYGFRNPFRISFDAGGEHSLFAGDAGQNAWEEVDIVTIGKNYGWNIKEGTHCFDPNNPNLSPGSCPNVSASGQQLTDPVIEYANAGQTGGIGTTVIGGFVYRGNALPQFNGSYIFGDFSKGFIQGNGSLFIARPPSSGGLWSIKELNVASNNGGRTGAFVRSFGQDANHEVYVMTSQMLGPANNTGKIFKIKPFNISRSFTANLSGSEVVPQPIDTSAKGNAIFELSDDSTRLHYSLMVENITNVTQAHIHLAPAGVNGQVIVWLYPSVPPNPILIPGRFDGLLAEGNITSVNLTGPLAGQPLNVLLEAMMKGNTYVNVHTLQVPGGEIRGQIRPAAPAATFNISGFKINSDNKSGVPGWTINLTNDTMNVPATTDAKGMYQFTGLVNGKYNVTEGMMPGWTPAGPTTLTVIINGADVPNQNFTNTPEKPPTTLGSISGNKIEDLNGNEVWNDGEKGLQGWTIELKGIGAENHHVEKETTTDDNGFYRFDDLPAGKYLVKEKHMKGYIPSSRPVIIVSLADRENSENNSFFNRPISSLKPEK